MQINSASSYTPSSGSLATGEQNRVAEQRDPLRVEKIQQSSEQSAGKLNQQVNEQAQKPRQVERFDIDPQAIALIEQEQQSQQSQTNQTFGSSNQSSQNANSTAYDQPPSQNKSAVAAYQSVNSISQRENIQQVFGVDLFA
jgi:hypothetical protein